MTRILIVDDHPLYREGLQGALGATMQETEFVGAGSAEEGLRRLREAPDFDLVLLDLHLPGMDGFAALSTYGEHFPMVPRVLISGSEEPEHLRRAFALGASGFIPKSLHVHEVTAAIRCVLDGSVFTPPAGPGAVRADADIANPGLTLRQLEALKLLGEGYTNKEIARALAISERTAKAHVRAVFEALGVDNRTQAVVAAQRAGWLRAPRGAA